MCLAIIFFIAAMVFMFFGFLVDPTDFVVSIVVVFVGIGVMILLQIILYRIMRAIMAGVIRDLDVVLKEHVAKTRGPFLQRGVRPRAGPYGAYIKFETQ